MALPATNTQAISVATITTAVTGTTTSSVYIGANPRSVVMDLSFAYGSGGTTAKFWVQTSLDGGTTWIDIAQIACTTSAKRSLYTLNNTSITTAYTPTDGSLADDTSKDGILGNYIRVKYTTTGTYAGATSFSAKFNIKA